ncbi:MAG: hypothetical protein AB7M12_12670 [Hyphomonadaceae bacterium]
MAGAWTICVDFGTACSKAAAAWRAPGIEFEPHHVRPLRLGEGDGDNPLMLKSVLYLDQGRVLFGETAWRRAQATNAAANRQALSSFKTLLSARDLDQSIGLLVSPRVDPMGVFRQRDLIVLFLAFLIRRIDAAQALDPLLAPSPCRGLRYSYPGWVSGDDVARHKLISRLFDEGCIVADLIPGDFGVEAGLSYDDARAALAQAARGTVASRIEGVVFEATAAAACRLVSGRPDPNRPVHAAVIDMGAGTTDIGGYFVTPEGDVEEIGGVQRTLDIAGDTFDRVLMNVIVKKAAHVKGDHARGLLWRALLPKIRGLKETVVSTGACAFEYGGRIVKVKVSELTRRGDFKNALKAVRAAYVQSLEDIAADALDAGRRDIAIVLAGGGANLPYLQKLAGRARPAKGRVRLKPEPLVPEWAHNELFDKRFPATFPQLSIAIGGALAPLTFVRQRSVSVLAPA